MPANHDIVMEFRAEVAQLRGQLTEVQRILTQAGATGGNAAANASKQWNIFESAITRAKWAAASFALSIATWRTFNFFRDATRDAIAFEKQLHVIQSISSGQSFGLDELGKQISKIGSITGKMPIDIAMAVREAQSILNTTMTEAVAVTAEAARMSVAMNTSIESAVTVLTRSMAVYGDKITDISEITEAFFDAVKIGGATAQQFADVWAKAIAPVASLTGLPIQAAGALLATGERILGAQSSATLVTSTIGKLYGATDKNAQGDIYKQLGLDPLTKGDSLEKFIHTLERMRQAVHDKEIKWQDFFDLRGMRFSSAAFEEQLGLLIKTARDTNKEVAEAMIAMTGTTAFQLEKAASAWATFRKDLGATVAQGILPILKEMNDYIGSGRGFWEGAGNIIKEQSQLVGSQLMADVAAVFTANADPVVAKRMQEAARAATIAAYDPSVPPGPKKTAAIAAARLKVEEYEAYRDRGTIGAMGKVFVDPTTAAVDQAKAAVAAQRAAADAEYLAQVTRVNKARGLDANGNPIASNYSTGTGTGGTGTGGTGAPAYRQLGNLNEMLWRSLQNTAAPDGLCLFTAGRLAKDLIAKTGATLLPGRAGRPTTSANAVEAYALKNGAMVYVPGQNIPAGSMVFAGNHVGIAGEGNKIFHNLSGKRFGESAAEFAHRFKGGIDTVWPYLQMPTDARFASGGDVGMTMADYIAPFDARISAKGIYAEMAVGKYGQYAPQVRAHIAGGYEAIKSKLQFMLAMGYPEWSPEVLQLQQQLQQQGFKQGEFDTGKAKWEIGRREYQVSTGLTQWSNAADAQVTGASYRMGMLSPEQLKPMAAELERVVSLYGDLASEARVKAITSSTGDIVKDLERQRDLLSQALQYDLQRVDANKQLGSVTAQMAHDWEAVATARAEVATQPESYDDDWNRMMVSFYAPVSGKKLMDQLYPDQGSGRASPSASGGISAFLAGGKGKFPGAGLLPGFLTATPTLTQEQIDARTQLALDGVKEEKAKLTGMDYLSMFGMVSQLTGMGGKAGGIGKLVSSYQTGVGLWSMLGSPGGGAISGMGAGSLWGIAGVLIGGLSGLFQKNKVDYEKWLSKIANNTGKMAQAYDQAFSVGPRGLVNPAMAFGGLRGGY